MLLVCSSAFLIVISFCVLDVTGDEDLYFAKRLAKAIWRKLACCHNFSGIAGDFLLEMYIAITGQNTWWESK